MLMVFVLGVGGGGWGWGVSSTALKKRGVNSDAIIQITVVSHLADGGREKERGEGGRGIHRSVISV